MEPGDICPPDINKIAWGDRPKGARNTADTTAKQHKDKEAKRLVPEKAKRIQGQNDSKNTEAIRHMIEKAKIEALIEKHRYVHRKHLTR